MDNNTLLLIIAGLLGLIAIIMTLNLLQKAGVNVYSLIKKLCDPNYKLNKEALKKHKELVKAEALKAKARKIEEEANK